MSKMLKVIGTTTAIGAFIAFAQPVLAEANNQGADEQNITSEAVHAKHNKQMQGSSQSGMMGNMGQMMGGVQSGMMGNMGQMMGGGHSSGYMASSVANPCAAEKNLSAKDVKNIIEGRLAWDGNKRLKVGGVKKKDDNTYTADIVTVDDSLVERLEVDRKTGATRRAE